MKTLKINPLKGGTKELLVPGDKSISHRAVMLGSIAKGETVVNNILLSADCLATIDCCRRLGINIKIHGTRLIIDGKGLFGLKQPQGTLDAGNSGTTIRLISGILAGQNYEVNITGDESVQKRPMGRIAKPLRLMGASIEGRMSGNEIFAPLTIFGGDLKAIAYELPVASAQVKSAVLLAGLFADGETSVIEKVRSRDHTERMLEHFGVVDSRYALRVTGRREFEGVEIDVPGDISSAAFFLVAGAIIKNAELRIMNVGVNPTRTGIIDVLHRMGARLEIENERLLSEEPRADIIVKSSELGAVRLDGEIIPRIIDEIPIIAVAATQAKGATEIRGARELRIKESDRIKTVASELRKFGASVEELDDGLRIEGPTRLKGARIDSHGDHRIAMAMAIAGLAAEGETVIENAECVETSFPGFDNILSSLAA
ncbi:MAG: 3-phosphoshikimate 1-carboxyvinyltransferase [Candidatus Margulisbacteria bacterium]|nr:3-phosphoshikimate 1-carboxyvinyltransferase [Candidatus Margulisiibacteriota bacterium]